MQPIEPFHRKSSTVHSHLCPCQILGGQIGLVSWIRAATGCTVGHQAPIWK